ncbi:putative type VI secretion system effector [Burkholderia pseudomallei]|uniref:putative type VI secretion system effector n=1 Tax=Burkholderia pseudomallei TaxID=28450 RepID=UPI000978D875|nr:putative type VI secretion system effector [Burkholderia pseudomallei]
MDNSRVVVLRGTVSNFSKERATGDFLLSDADRSTAGLTAVAAALAGSGGAIGLASLAGTKEEADKVAFELDGKKVTGWLMWSPFKNGDEVEVAAELMRDGTYRAFAVLKPNDRTIALYPHCSRGRIAHYKNSIKWLMIAFSFVFLGSCGVMAIIFFANRDGDWKGFAELMGRGGLIGFVFYAVIAFNISRKFMPFVKMAEGIFQALEWRDVKKVDLPARSRAAKKEGNKPGLGKLYFKY